ncbi:hypothetical protein ONS95_000467 [Cadophora gregata]|uniref:uncharacterized protein n=1 Tax=Cadophora gregata TaxID=51156 RepID=UPI0026DC9724|nr:uncharacterized protein ONS95_000467 [Cadophora gregata]KAK0125525.1 hypothetical protein ONS96_009362 [Cadophora gregata f. sp. sojae]KAK0128495.1 hypothetical protein ONS95_000467 [Cadophora gregata]
MSDPLITATTQAVVLGSLSNVLAQAFSAYESQKLFSFDVVDILRCAVLGAVVTPPNFLWQNFLERKFPSKKEIPKELTKKHDTTESSEVRLSKSNTVAKFFLDQTIGCWINTLVFLLLFGFLKGKGALEIENEVKTGFWSMVLSSYRFWPLVTLTNLILVPPSQRILVGNLAGLVWGIFVNLVMVG